MRNNYVFKDSICKFDHLNIPLQNNWKVVHFSITKWYTFELLYTRNQFFFFVMQNTNQNPNMIRCRKCHKWYDRTKARTAKASKGIYDEEIDWTFSTTVTRVFCPHCGYWHR